ncbi:MAG: MBL fold metallo-hydrolase [Candidatus Ranarchaeia archaeon]
MIEIKYFGYATVKISSDKAKIIFDPGIIDGTPLVAEDESVNIICVSNITSKHFGNAIELSKKQKAYIIGPKQVIDKALENGAQPWRVRPLADTETYPYEDVKITGYHLPIGPPDAPNRPVNFGYVVDIDELAVAHFGEAIGIGAIARLPVNIALLPVGGETMLDGKMALQALNQIHPQLAIPIAAKKPEDAQYVVEHNKYFSKETEIRILKPNETIQAGWYVGKEFRVM